MHDIELRKEKWQLAIEYRYSKIDLVLQEMILESTADNIHDFRVEIKKLKALIRLLSFNVRNDAPPRFPKSLNNIYKSLGGLREWQIQKQKIGEAAGEMHDPAPLNYLNTIDSKMNLWKRRVRERIRHLTDLKKSFARIKGKCPEKLSPESITGFIQTKIQTIQHLLQNGDCDDESLHEMRKKLKDVQYILSGTEKSDETPEDSSRLKSIQQISADLGDFHDLYIALILLNRELKRHHEETDEKKQLRRIRDKWRAEKETLRLRTIQSTKALIQQNFPELVRN